ncbi:YraN family protein [Candidatus Uhrbacteria bacterium]|nr:YraN family protein [Candidatus Uhrbacteria bacterium]
MPDSRKLFGTSVEKFAAEHLAKKGFQIIEHQYKSVFGEIDLICRDGDEIVFVEVKARQSSKYGYPEESVTPKKLRHIVRSGLAYLRSKNPNTKWRIDVVAVEFLPEVSITHLQAIDISDGVW